MLLVIFLLTWAGIAYYGIKTKKSRVISFGGGFIGGLIALIIASVVFQTKEIIPPPEKVMEKSTIPAQIPNSSVIDKGQFSEPQICLAALIDQLAWSENPTGGQSYIGDFVKEENQTYIFTSQQGDYRCKINGDRVVWSSNTGRWRDSEFDDYITFRTNQDRVIINTRYSDKSTNMREYEKELLSSHAK